MSSVSPSLPASVPVFLGVDGGGSHTRAWLIDADGNLHGHGAAGPSNPSNVGTTGAFDAIVSATGLARRQAGVEASDIAAAFVACAGIKTPAEGQALAQLLTTAGLAGQVTVRNDTEAALAGGLGGAPGIALVGTLRASCGVRPEWRTLARSIIFMNLVAPASVEAAVIGPASAALTVL